jgi:hypothetical protein
MATDASTETPAPSPGRTAVGLFLISAAVLALQVLQTRILSVQMWHHHSYMVVTMTLLGFAAAGSLATVRPSLTRGNVGRTLSISASLFAISTLLGYLVLQATADRAAEMTAEGRYITLSVFYSYLLVPYFFGGLVVTVALSTARRVSLLYFFNLVGSAVGAWAFIGLIAPLGGERLLVGCALLGPLAALVFHGASPDREPSRGAGLGALATLGICAVTFVMAPTWLAIEVASSKAMTQMLEYQPEAKVVGQRWTPTCRLDLVKLPDLEGSAQPINIYQDGDAITVMHSDASWAHLRAQPAGLRAPAPARRERRGGARGARDRHRRRHRPALRPRHGCQERAGHRAQRPDRRPGRRRVVGVQRRRLHPARRRGGRG